MITSPEILNELKAISPLLAGVEKINVFQAPQGYFDELHLRIADYAILNKASAVDNINSRNLQQVPEGYFDTLSDSILAKVKAAYLESAGEELRKLSPMLYGLKDENVFSVPDGYFESFAEDVVERLKPQPAKIITMKKANSWWKYAAAAVLTGAIAVSSLQIFNSSSYTNTPKLAASQKTALPGYVQASFQYKTENDLNAGIAKLSDDDIIKFLEKNGNVMDNELLTNNIDVSEMPSQTDYLTDENTLNTYLDKIDAKTVDKLNP
ncbi:MAG: hypothetical protein ABI834_11060 [Ginsengibacter sp.]